MAGFCVRSLGLRSPVTIPPLKEIKRKRESTNSARNGGALTNQLQANRERSNGFCNRCGFSRFHSWAHAARQLAPLSKATAARAPERRCTRTSGSTGRAGLRPRAPADSPPSGCRDVTDARSVETCRVFAATWIRQPLGTTPGSRSSSRLRPSAPSQAPRSTPTPSATRRSPPTHKPKTTSAQRQVSLSLFHPPPCCDSVSF